MSTSSSNSELKNSSPKREATKKLDFLLDTIDTEVADLADVVEVAGPILADKTSGGEVSTISLDDEAVGMDSLELDMDLFGESDEPPPEDEPADNQAQAALDAMSDAEGEVEAMLSMEASPGSGSPPAAETNEEKVDADIAKALDELLATREVDASKLLAKKAVSKQEKEPKNSPVVREGLPEDLFDDLEKDFKAAGDWTAAAEPNVEEEEFSKDLFEELEMDFQSGEEIAAAAEPVDVEERISEDLLGDFQLEDERTGKNEGGATTTSGSEEELADLLTEKIEALVARLVDERLSAIAERVIKEKINKIFSSMK
ncbi:MAG: hypothetical protein ACWGP1_10170 [Syntrophobacteria bacterium]